MTTRKEQPWRKLGLTDDEYSRITAHLGREPNPVELNVYSVMWSEHCSYKRSRETLRLLPSEGPAVLQGPGEDAGVVDLGGGWAAAFKIESHNHPTAVNPFQGAATGAGGIIRDIVAMGARPAALLGSLYFGPPEEERSRFLFERASAGLDWYGREAGVPVAGKELCFEDCYRNNPLVNVMCVGLAPAGRIMSGCAAGEGNLVILAGAKTGRDGIHGVTFASDELAVEKKDDAHSAVPAGDAALGKALIEATLEVVEKELVVGVQDLGGAGLSCALTETAARAGGGMEIDLDRAALREEGITAGEILISETQERMLLIARPQNEQAVAKAFTSRGLSCEAIGRVTGGDRVVVKYGGAEVARVPAGSVAGGAPAVGSDAREPEYYRELGAFDLSSLPPAGDLNSALLKILASPGRAGADYMRESGPDPAAPGFADAVLLETEPGPLLAVALAGCSRRVFLDPYRGSIFAVAAAARRLACSGAKALGITDGLNFGNPEKPEVFWQFRRSVEGIAAACRALKLPVVGGNVSFYNEAGGEAIYPTPVIGALGLIEEGGKRCGAGFSGEKDWLYLLGAAGAALGGSLFLKAVHGRVAGALPAVDLELELRLQELLRRLTGEGLSCSAHSVEEGGLAAALAESALLGGCGARVELAEGAAAETLLFGEGPARVLLSVKPGAEAAHLEKLAREAAVPVLLLGRTGGERICIGAGGKSLIDLPLKRLQKVYREAEA